LPENIFTGRNATCYDELDQSMFADSVLIPVVDFLEDLAGGGRVLEFAIGTGRVAIPLHERGIDVSGIELSTDMVAELYSKTSEEAIPAYIGDMAFVKVPGKFNLVYLVYNTITNLITQDEQIDCFCNAANHLEEGGHFLIEVSVPAIQKLSTGETLHTFEANPNHVGIDEYDLLNQTVTSHHYRINENRVDKFDSTHRYAWPSEYDLMARIAGMKLVQRWSTWNRDEFTSASVSHISVWQKGTV